MKKYYLFLPFFILFSQSQTKTFIREYTYTAGEADSKITSRAISLEQVKRILLEEIGIYLHSEMITTKEEKNEDYNELSKQQIQSITAGITETKIVEEKWNGEKYYIKASITLDPNEVNKNIARIGADQEKLKEMVDVKRKADDAFAEIERLRKELNTIKSEKDKLSKQKEYNVASNNLSAMDWVRKGNNSTEIEDWDNAILYYQKAIELNPSLYISYSMIGNAYRIKGNLEKAISYYNKSIELNSCHYSSYIGLGSIYITPQDIDKAIQLFKKSIECNQQEFTGYYFLGFCYFNKLMSDSALIYLHKSIVLNPQFTESYYYVGKQYERKTELDSAIKYFNKTIEIDSKYYQAYLDLSFAYQEKGNLDKSIQFCEKAIEINPKYAEAYFFLGAVYHKTDFQKALGLYKKAGQLGFLIAQEWLTKNGYTW